MKVGFIGLGTMGASMAYNCLQGGNEMVVHDIRRESATQHLEAGAVWAGLSPRGGRSDGNRVHVAARPDRGGGRGPGRGRHPRGHERRQGLLRPQHQHAHAHPPHPRAGRRPRRPRPRRAGQRRPARRGVAQSRHLGRAETRTCSTAASPCWTASATKPTTSAPSAAAQSPSWCTTAPATSCRRRWPRCSPWASRPAWSRWPCGRPVRKGAQGRRGTFEGLAEHLLPGNFDPPDFALRLARKDVDLAVGVGREYDVPMRLAQLTLQEMTEALNPRLGPPRLPRSHAAARGARRGGGARGRGPAQRRAGGGNGSRGRSTL